ncbi:MAG: porin [Rickettsiaceae bacterium]|nr:porin [Rickettsiaceae bacterium]
MNRLIKYFLITTSIITFAGKALAANKVESGNQYVESDLKIKISAYADFQAGVPTQSRLKSDEKNVSANRKDFAFYNSAAAVLNISKEVDDITYGGKIVLVPTAKKKGAPTYNGSHVYVSSEFGKVEAGSPIDAASTLFVDAGAITAAVDDWERYTKFDAQSLSHEGLSPSFASFDEFFLDSKLVTNLENRSYSSEPSRTVNYYTPKFDLGTATKVQAGISYTPDSSNTGADNPDKNSSGVDKRKITKDGSEFFELDRTVKDAITGGVTVEQNISDGVDFKIGVTGEYGKAAGSAKKKTEEDGEDKTLAIYKLKDLRSYNIGAVLSIGSFSVAGSYGSLENSLTTREFHKTGTDTKYYTGAVAYNQGPFTASVSYFRSNQFKNTVDTISLGTDYVLAPGFKPYAVISQYELKGRPEFFPEVGKRKSRGTVAIIGTKLSL